MLYTVIVKKELTAIRLRPEQVAKLRKMISREDKETTVSTLIRRAVDEFIEKQEGRKKKKY